MFVPSFLALWWPKIDRKSGFPQLFAKTVGSIHCIPGIYTYGISLWTPIDFRVRALIFGPLVAKNWPKIGVSATFRENCRLDSFHPWDLYLWGKSLDPYRFSCSCPHFGPLVAKNWPKIGVSATFRENCRLDSFHPWDLYLWGKSLDPYRFSCSCPHFGPLVAKNWPKIGVSATFRENCRLDSFRPWDLYLWGKSLDPYRFSCSCPHFWPSGGQKLTENRGFRNFSRKLFLRFPNFLYQLQPRYLPYHDTLVGRVMPKFFSNKFFLNDSHQCSYHNDLKIGLFVGYFLMGWVLIRAGVYCPHLWAQLVVVGAMDKPLVCSMMVPFFNSCSKCL